MSAVRGDLWKVTVPLDLDGMYVIEVSAYDEAGNISFCTKMLLIVDPATLCAKLISLDYTVEVVSKEYDVTIKNNDFKVETIYPHHHRKGCCCE